MPVNSKIENLSHKLVRDELELEVAKPLVIEYVNVDDIYPNDYNPNMHTADSFDLLIKSLLYFGFTMPIVVNRRTMQIVDGENRYRAACVIGYELVPVCFVDFDEEKTKYATIMHRRINAYVEVGEKDLTVYKKLDEMGNNDHKKVLLQDRKQ